MRRSIPPLPQYVFMAWCLVKHRDDFTFTFTFTFTRLFPRFRDFTLWACVFQISGQKGRSKSLRTESITKHTLYNNKHSLRSNTKGNGGKTHETDSQNSDTAALSGRELYHLQVSLQGASPETSGSLTLLTCVIHLLSSIYSLSLFLCFLPSSVVAFLLLSTIRFLPQMDPDKAK
jgi:hypothetical protein